MKLLASCRFDNTAGLAFAYALLAMASMGLVNRASLWAQRGVLMKQAHVDAAVAALFVVFFASAAARTWCVSETRRGRPSRVDSRHSHQQEKEIT